MEQLDQEIKEYFDSAPEIIKATARKVFSEEQKIISIAKNNGLEESLLPELQMEVFFIALGLEPLSQFRNNLIQELGITYNQALKISSEVTEQIFGTIVLDILKKIEAGIPIEDTIINSQIENQLAALKQVATPPSANPKTTPEIASNNQPDSATLPTKPEPVYFIPDHNQMEKMEGPHLHSQNIMPSSAASISASQSNQPKPAFKSIVDQKLSGIVRSASSIYGFQKQVDRSAPAAQETARAQGTAPTQTPSDTTTKPPQPSSYKGADPYREPIE